jgi:tight adherence protein C
MHPVAVTFVAVFLLILTGGLALFYREAVVTRLASVVLPPGRSGEKRPFLADEQSSIEKALDPFQKVVPRSPEEISAIRRRLTWAGYRKDAHLNIFYGAKVVVPLILAALATATRAYDLPVGPFFVYAVSGGLGFLLPDFWLERRIRARQLRIQLALPDALDLMVICIEAGLGLDQAVVRVADELALTHPVLAEEFRLLNLEQRAGRPRAEAWRRLAERTEVGSVNSLAAMLIQADRFGTSLARPLRIHSDTLRIMRRQQAEEQAAKTTVKLVFPLVLFIFPSLFLVVLGPAVIVGAEGFVRYLLSN